MKVITGRLISGNYTEVRSGGDERTLATIDIKGRLNVPLGGFVGFLVMEHGDPSMKTEEIERILNSRPVSAQPSSQTSGSKGKSSGGKR